MKLVVIYQMLVRTCMFCSAQGTVCLVHEQNHKEPAFIAIIYQKYNSLDIGDFIDKILDDMIILNDLYDNTAI